MNKKIVIYSILILRDFEKTANIKSRQSLPIVEIVGSIKKYLLSIFNRV